MVLSKQQDYAQSVVVVQNEESITNIIKEFYISAGLPWHLVNVMYVPVNCNEKFHWLLVVIAPKKISIRIYDSLLKLKNMKSSPEIQS